jgi:hypothetical protein
MFAGKDTAYPSEEPFRFGSWPYPQTLDQAENTYTNTLAYYENEKLRIKKVYNNGVRPWSV